MPPARVGAKLLKRKEMLFMSSRGLPHPLRVKKQHRFVVRPTTRLGKWAAGFAAASIVLLLGWRLMGPLGGFPGLACGLAGGVLALGAILRRGERSVAVFAALVPFLNVVVFLLAELLIGHD
jgi:hypothetical protein